MAPKSKIKGIAERLPETKQIMEDARRRLLKKHGVSTLEELGSKLDPSEIVVEMERQADALYRAEERKALGTYLIDRGLTPKESERVVGMILDEGNLTKSISNIRRSRAGSASESILVTMLQSKKIPCERGRRGKSGKTGYRPDVVVPNNDTLTSSPQNAYAIAVKRTLRERWAEDLDIFKFPNGAFLLLTPDPDFNEGKAEDMVKRGMKEIYIPDELYNKHAFLTKFPAFRKISTLPSNLQKFLATHKVQTTF